MKKHPASKMCAPGETPPLKLLKGTAAALAASFHPGAEDVPDAQLAALPSVTRTHQALWLLLDLMFPGRLAAEPVLPRTLPAFLNGRLQEIWETLCPEIRRALPYRWIGEASRVDGIYPTRVADLDAETTRILTAFTEKLPEIRRWITEDIQAAYEGDPAALTYAEVLLAYPGVLSIAAHRLAHELYLLHVPIIPRVMSEWMHGRTGADIHPGAAIGHSFFMDHATGIVIGETTRIGNHVKIYQGVTLGARSFAMDEQGHPVKRIIRHPNVEDGVVIYANATILGGETTIGKGSIIGANVFLDASVPPNSIVSNDHPNAVIRQKKPRRKS